MRHPFPYGAMMHPHMNPFSAGAFVLAIIALVATGFRESRRESFVSALVFAGIGVILLFV